MSTSGDLISGVFFLVLHSPLNVNNPTTPPPPTILTQPPWLKTLHVYGVLWSTCYQNLLSLLQWWNNLCQWLNTCKNVPETVQWIKKSSNVVKKMGLLSTKAQKSAKVHFIWEIWWPVWESGRSVPYLGDSRTIRESWHNYALYENDCVKTGVTMYLWWTFYQWRAPKGNSAFKCTTGNASLELNIYNNNNLYTCTCIPSVTALAMRLRLLTIRLSSYREGEIQGWFLL